MRIGARKVTTAFVTVLLLGATVAADPPVPPPTPALPLPEGRNALLLETAEIRESTNLSAEPLARLPAGTVLRWLGESVDAFGRTWQVVGDPEAWRLQDPWYVIPFEPGSIPRGTTSAWITGFREPAEPEEGEAEGSMSIPADWWTRTVSVPSGLPFEVGGLVGVPAIGLPDDQLEQILALIDPEALGPWPEEPVWGRLHVPAAFPLVFRYADDGWQPLRGPVFVGAGPNLMGNPALRQDPEAPVEAAGRGLDCWTLVGALDATGAAVGRLEVAPAAPESAAPAELPALPGARFFGYRDLADRILPPAPAATVRPVRAEPVRPTAGVHLTDSSRRQAVFLEQSLPRPLVLWLRGRTVVLRVRARKVPGAEGTATAGVELTVGEVRETRSQPVGEQVSEMLVEVEVPPDAEEITVRLIPQDRSIAVQETGDVVFDGASLIPADWHLTPETLELRRVRLQHYAPARRYTRADMTVSRRTASELARTWEAVREGDWPEAIRAGILSGRLRSGMSQEAVELAWGAPEGRESLAGGLSRWDWRARTATFDEEGRLISWAAQPREASTREAGRCVADLFTVGPGR